MKTHEHTKADHELVASIQEGGQTDWGKLFERYRTHMIRFCSTYVHDVQAAEDLAHDTFLKIREKAHTFKQGAEVRPWLYRIARNTCLDFLRKAERKNVPIRWKESAFATSTAVVPAVVGPSPATELEKAEMIEKVLDILDQLDEEHRSTFLLKYVEDLSRNEIALSMGIPEATVKSRLYYATKKIRENLKND